LVSWQQFSVAKKQFFYIFATRRLLKFAQNAAFFRAFGGTRFAFTRNVFVKLIKILGAAQIKL
jgi:hypothetical protein